MFRPSKKAFGGERFGDDTAGEDFLKWLEARLSSFYDDNINTSRTLGKMCFEMRRLYRKIMRNFLFCIVNQYIKKQKFRFIFYYTRTY